MQRHLTDAEFLEELEPVAEENLNHHLSVAKEWHPHDYVPWDRGRNFAALGGEDWDPEQSQLSEVAKVAMVTNLLTEDNLPSYHRGAANHFSLDSAWGHWVNRWTAEENRHGIVIRDYLVVTRGVDPVALERARMEHMSNGYDPTEEERKIHEPGPLMISAYATLQELATRVSHRNTGKVCDDPIAEAMLARVATDENLHMVFYRNMFSAGFDLAPDQAMEAACAIIEGFQMPGRGMPNWRRNSVIMAKHGIYDLRQHLQEVVMPSVRKWRIFERNDVSAVGEKRREQLAAYLEDLEKQVIKFEEQRDRMLAREAAKAEREAEKAAARA
ncbi:acyl-[acyl-carrier protein] desaturase [Mycolicibacterium mageritense DSM 44476 = CIP 104973]|uniref:Acyl-[acyl-carrier protein] desaturase n=1 Tax=Mycolicibacterium mageritense TaxID=53462 RepID=A0ABM7I4K0_MYCME|nr:acyl-ACP desaturase [Mycolicibacterium mageritense]MCC9179893.1 acyl-ACP desaturase [Mycolicibacterium mageritense]BBX37833.1 putative acyl-[acyl-carrier protein] desaturase [Mycolicibacterium mageritense]CDO25499.1 acyl-[acyl-carrier protein] desaturase [Mycolicibacterium mageritense DSM 44476 = CIP 104973]